MTNDEQSIHDIVTQLEAAWNRYDSAAIGAWFAEDAEFIQIFGGQLTGRTAIEASHRAIFDTIYRNSRATWIVKGLRFVRPDVAVVFTHARVEFKEDNQPRALDARPTMVVVKEDDRWRIVTFQNTRISEMPLAAQAAARLAR